jgi:predicted nucleic acid-binding protein
VIRQREAVFVDSGAWIALALSRDPLHERAREQWDLLRAAGTRLHTSVPVVIETFTFVDCNANRDVALAWKEWGRGRTRIRLAYTFDHHFAVVGLRMATYRCAKRGSNTGV